MKNFFYSSLKWSLSTLFTLSVIPSAFALTVVHNNNVHDKELGILVYCPNTDTETNGYRSCENVDTGSPTNRNYIMDVQKLPFGRKFRIDKLGDNPCGFSQDNQNYGRVCLLAYVFKGTQQELATNPIKNSFDCTITFNEVANEHTPGEATATDACDYTPLQ